MRYSYLGKPDTQPSGNRNDFAVPFDVFETKDGSMAIAAPTDNHWRELANAMGHPEWGHDEDKATIRARVKNREPLDLSLIHI